MKRAFPHKHITTFANIPKLVIYDQCGMHSETVPWNSIDKWVTGDDVHTIILDPPYQRGRVWSTAQRIAYIEYILRGGKSSRDILFNQRLGKKGLWAPLECVDGLQRLTSVHMFMHDKLKVFDKLACSEMVAKSKYKKFPTFEYQLNIQTMHIESDQDILRFYLELNTGGTPHSDAEITRVTALYKTACKKHAAKKVKKVLE